MRIPRYILVLTGVLIFSLIVVSLLYVWFPEYVSGEVFSRILISFVILLGGAVLLSGVQKLLSSGGADKKNTPET